MTDEYPKLDGLLVQVPRSDLVYLIDQGKARLIPSTTTFNNVFASRVNVVWSIWLPPVGTPFPDNAAIFKFAGSNKVYLLDVQNGQEVKRYIVNPPTMSRYNFRNPVIFHDVDIPDGTPIEWPTP